MPNKCVPIAAVEAARTDIEANRREYIFNLPVWAEKRLQACLNDPRDLPVALLLSNIILTAVPAACCVAASRSHLLGAIVLACNYVLFLQRFLVALLHVTEHRRLFRKEFDGLNLITPCILAPLYGLPSGMYKLHHKIMHHVEGNHAPLDSSSTELYQRDSLSDFCRYWAQHAVGAWVRVPLYAYKQGRLDLMQECLTTETLYLLAAAMVCWFNPVAALWLVLVPFLLTSLAIMFGNWSQHIFVDGCEPQNVFRLTYNCLGCPDNQLTFNDGYHIIHHLNSRTHWSELPQRFLDTFDQHSAQQAFIFRGIGFFDVGFAVMTGQLERLADCLIPCGEYMAALSKAELVLLMRERLRPLRSA